MLLRITAVTFILICTSVAWLILGSTIDHRTGEFDDRLRPGVASIWGSPQEQGPPNASYEQIDQEKIETETDGRKTARIENRRSTVPILLEASRINVDLKLEYRQKGLLWYGTYVVDFEGVYTFHNPTEHPQSVSFRLKFPAEHAIYDGFAMEVNGHPLQIMNDKQGAGGAAQLRAGETASLRSALRLISRPSIFPRTACLPRRSMRLQPGGT